MAIPTITAQQEVSLQALGEPHVRLRLDGQTAAAVATDLAQEVMVISQQRLTVMPNMPPAVMGLINHRSRIFWVLDLPQLFGLTPLDPRSLEYHLAILRVQEQSVGLAVQQVQGVTRFDPEAVQSPLDHDIPAGLVPYLRGCLPAAEARGNRSQSGRPNELLLVLDGAAIAAYQGAPSGDR